MLQSVRRSIQKDEQPGGIGSTWKHRVTRPNRLDHVDDLPDPGLETRAVAVPVAKSAPVSVPFLHLT
jgi:hypothetical protein